MKAVRGRPRDESHTRRRQEQILSASASVFAHRGYPDADVQEVADICNVAKGHNLPLLPEQGKLFLATVDRAMSELCDFVRSKSAKVDDPLERLTVAIRAYLAYFRDHPGHAELLIIERAEFRERKTPTYIEHRKANTGEWEQLYAGLIREGRLRDIPARRIVDVISDLVYGTMFTNHFSGQHRSVAAQARDVIDIVFHGILSAAERRRRHGKE